MADETKTVKSGVKTSEFWLSAAAAVLGILMTSGVVPTGSVWDKVIGVCVTLLASLGYTVSRTMVKK